MRIIAAILALGICLGTPPAVSAGDDSGPVSADNDSGTKVTAPPLTGVAPVKGPLPRPLPITAAQDQALQQLSQQPEHAPASLARASYSPEAARKLTEFGVHATQVAIPGSILIALIAAAPL